MYGYLCRYCFSKYYDCLLFCWFVEWADCTGFMYCKVTPLIYTSYPHNIMLNFVSIQYWNHRRIWNHLEIDRRTMRWGPTLHRSAASRMLKCMYGQHFLSGLGIRSFPHSLKSLRTNEQMWAIFSGCSGQMSDCEQIAQVAHDKWANVSNLLRSLRTNERITLFFEQIKSLIFLHRS